MVAQEKSQKNIKPSIRVGMAFQNSSPSDISYNIPQDNAAYAVAFQGNHFPPKPICNHCRRTGHTVQKCYNLHGYPPGHKLYQRSSNSSTCGPAQNTSTPQFPSQNQFQQSQSTRPPVNANAFTKVFIIKDTNDQKII